MTDRRASAGRRGSLATSRGSARRGLSGDAPLSWPAVVVSPGWVTRNDVRTVPGHSVGCLARAPTRAASSRSLKRCDDEGTGERLLGCILLGQSAT